MQFDLSATELTAPLSVVHLSQMVTDEYALFRSRDDVAAWIGLICAEREGAVAVMTNPGGEGKPN